MATKVGDAIKAARTEAGLSQEKLAKRIAGLTASQLGKAERGDAELTNDILKRIAKETGVTQTSLLNAAKSSTKKTTATKKTTTTKKTTKKTTTSGTSMKVTATEKRLINAYRAATTEDRKAALDILLDKEEAGSLDLGDVLGGLLSQLKGD